MENAMYFIAIEAPESINEQVLQWKHFMRDRFRCVAALKSPAHITLVSPFWMNVGLQPALENIMTEFSANQTSFVVNLKNFDCFRPQVIFIHVERSEILDSLKSGYEKHLLTNGFSIKRETRPFHPHITIANRDVQKKDFAEAWEHFSRKQYITSFIADGVSLLKHNGTIWEPVYKASFPLT